VFCACLLGGVSEHVSGLVGVVVREQSRLVPLLLHELRQLLAARPGLCFGVITLLRVTHIAKTASTATNVRSSVTRLMLRVTVRTTYT
jgi:hypothetical protein